MLFFLHFHFWMMNVALTAALAPVKSASGVPTLEVSRIHDQD